ncbi:DoxX family protein [Lacimicrobium sp. SS2-24]|uniref:HvfX family Cu-binding RiPP maturation protein n=1 Tax=Lacimicrobium sp. SS2-24 TaxID=2005569 RepID=UPI000B4A7FF7|nr:DoxX family protein [Lacimicrobium sp. SS2-24]
MINTLAQYYFSMLDRLQCFNGIPSLLIRLYLAPVMIQAGWNKYISFADTAAWFGNPDWGLGLPFPALMASLAIAAELIGGILLLLGLLTRLVTLPLMVTMLVAAFTVHWQNGWPAIADTSSWLANGTLFMNESVMASADKLSAANSILQEHGNYEWLTASGKFVVLNNGIEFAITYFVMLLALLFIGGGRYLSLDFWIKRTLCNKLSSQ